jgi:hypothetical protein
MHYIIVLSSFRRKPSCLLATIPFMQSKPNILSLQGLSIGSTIPFLHLTLLKGNLANISPTIKINISIKDGIVEEIIIGAACTPQEIVAYKSLFQEYRDIFTWSYTEMPGLDPSIVEHCIDTWPDITPVCQKQRLLHPAKAAAIKAEIDKLRTARFIYLIAYTSWVSNPVPVDKK